MWYCSLVPTHSKITSTNIIKNNIHKSKETSYFTWTGWSLYYYPALGDLKMLYWHRYWFARSLWMESASDMADKLTSTRCEFAEKGQGIMYFMYCFDIQLSWSLCLVLFTTHCNRLIVTFHGIFYRSLHINHVSAFKWIYLRLINHKDFV